MAMTISVRPVDFDSERDELLRILQENLPALPHGRRFQWLYRDNPDGPGWSWFVYEPASGSIVGVTSVFPRSMWVGQRSVMCGQVGDFAIAATHRSLGPALLLQRSTFETVNREFLSFCYDCPPHAAGMATFNRLRLQPNCAMTRYALPLRVDRRLKKTLGFHPPVVTSLMNALLRMSRRSQVHPGSLDVNEYEEPFNDEFSGLDSVVSRVDVIRGRRTAEHLNWRYRKNPLQTYRVLTARQKGELFAYVIFYVNGADVRIIDLFGKDLSAGALVLLDALARRYEASCQTIDVVLSDGTDLLAPIVQAHFRPRSTAAQVVAYARPGNDISTFLERKPRWSFSTAELQA